MAEPSLKRPVTRSRVIFLCSAMGLLLLCVAFVSLLVGTADISRDQLFALVTGEDDQGEYARLILFEIRLPRIILAALVG